MNETTAIERFADDEEISVRLADWFDEEDGEIDGVIVRRTPLYDPEPARRRMRGNFGDLVFVVSLAACVGLGIVFILECMGWL